MTAVQWPVSKLEIINSALAQTRDNLVTVLDDGSDEYTVASAAYERALAFMLEDGGWVHATKVVANLPAVLPVPTDTQFDSAYALPADCLHLIWVRQNDVPALYSILAGQIVIRAFGSTAPVSIKYVSTDNSDPIAATPTFVVALQTFVEAGIYRGLHGNLQEGAAVYKEALALLQRAKTRSDQQKPKQSLFNSRLRMARRVRRPWFSDPTGWGGTGSPGW